MAKLPAKDVVMKWSNEQLLQWLEKEEFDDCLQAFRIRAITGAKFLELSDEFVITFSELKLFRRRQIVKCINECKAQVCNARRLVDNIKDRKKHKNQISDDVSDDDDIGWGSDFDDEDSDDNELTQEDINDNESKTSFTEEVMYEPVSDYMSNGSVDKTANTSHMKDNSNESMDSSSEKGNKCHIKGDISYLIHKKTQNNQIMQISANGVKDVDPSPKASPRLLPKPPKTKPEVPKNKPQIIPRKPFLSNGLKTVPNQCLKRPPSEPPPPPLPKSPPPNSPVIPQDFHSVFNDIENNNECENYETIVLPIMTEDEYLSPIVMDRKSSSSTISSMSTSYSTRDGESSICQSLSSQTSNQCLSNNKPEEDYEPFLEMNKKDQSIPDLDMNEENYEVVNDSQTFNGNKTGLLPVGQRPQLPKVKESSAANSRTKLISDVFPNLQNWNRLSKDKNKTKEKHESDSNADMNSSMANSLDVINNNNNCFAISARPLPPLPTPPKPLPQTNLFASNESLRDYEWFHTVEREDAEALLMTQDEDGAYLVRESKRAGKSNPFTLTIFHNGRVFHLNIRKRPDGLYALGKEKSREKTFKTVADLVSYHTTEPILLTTRGTPAGKTRLIITPSS